MVWARPPVLKTHAAQVFEFYLFDPKGRPPEDMALEMGMLGHAVVVSGSVFAVLHPFGTPALAAMRLAGQLSDATSAMPVEGRGGQGREWRDFRTMSVSRMAFPRRENIASLSR